MNFNVLLGVAALAYGLYTLYARAEKLAKLEAMKEQSGNRNGTIVHVVAYSVVPMLVGVVLVVSAL